MSDATERNQIVLLSAEVAIDGRGNGGSGGQDNIVLLRFGNGVIVEMVNGNVVLWRKTNVELAGELTNLFRDAGRRSEDQNISSELGELEQFLGSKSGSVSYPNPVRMVWGRQERRGILSPLDFGGNRIT